MFTARQRVEIHYPTTTLVSSQTDFYPRLYRVRSVRDLVAYPLKPQEFLRRPFTRRGRWLASVIDLHSNQLRQIYPVNALEFRQDCQLRIGEYRDGRLVDLVSRGFECDRRERIVLSRLLIRLQTLDWGDSTLGIFADDLRLIT